MTAEEITEAIRGWLSTQVFDLDEHDHKPYVCGWNHSNAHLSAELPKVLAGLLAKLVACECGFTPHMGYCPAYVSTSILPRDAVDRSQPTHDPGSPAFAAGLNHAPAVAREAGTCQGGGTVDAPPRRAACKAVVGSEAPNNGLHEAGAEAHAVSVGRVGSNPAPDTSPIERGLRELCAAVDELEAVTKPRHRWDLSETEEP